MQCHSRYESPTRSIFHESRLRQLRGLEQGEDSACRCHRSPRLCQHRIRPKARS